MQYLLQDYQYYWYYYLSLQAGEAPAVRPCYIKVFLLYRPYAWDLRKVCHVLYGVSLPLCSNTLTHTHTHGQRHSASSVSAWISTHCSVCARVFVSLAFSVFGLKRLRAVSDSDKYSAHPCINVSNVNMCVDVSMLPLYFPLSRSCTEVSVNIAASVLCVGFSDATWSGPGVCWWSQCSILQVWKDQSHFSDALVVFTCDFYVFSVFLPLPTCSFVFTLCQCHTVLNQQILWSFLYPWTWLFLIVWMINSVKPLLRNFAKQYTENKTGRAPPQQSLETFRMLLNLLLCFTYAFRTTFSTVEWNCCYFSGGWWNILFGGFTSPWVFTFVMTMQC